jgi:hypothetical protein
MRALRLMTGSFVSRNVVGAEEEWSMNGDGKQETGISNLEYDLVTTLSNLLEGHEVLEEYASDADEAGDTEAAEIFRSIQLHNQQAALRIRTSLGRLMSQ